MNRDTERLVQHFRLTDVYEGRRGDLDNASPGQSAIRVMVERKQKIMELEAERKVILTILGSEYAGEFEVGDKQRPLDTLVSEVLSRLRRASAILDERDRQDEKWGPQDHSLFEWVTILTEEVGELAAAALGHTFGTAQHPDLDWRKEAVQIAALALAMLEQPTRHGSQ